VTYFELLKAASLRIRRADAIELLSFVTELSAAELVRDYGEVCADSAATALEPLIIRAEHDEPAAYITGKREFRGLTFQVTPDVLIPRSDSEPLVDAAVRSAQTRGGGEITILDLCCGSGCLGLAAIAKLPGASLIAIDISDKALAVTRRNAETLGLAERLTLIQADALSVWENTDFEADILISNPPYVTASEMSALDRSVRDYEPHLALFGGTDGLDFYRALAENIPRLLAPDGVLILECGSTQKSAVEAITAGISNCVIIPAGTQL
jgi:release factor glutamine methyltransferase